MTRSKLFAVAFVVSSGLVLAPIANAAVTKPAAPKITSISSSAVKNGKVEITVTISLPTKTGGSGITGSKVIAGGKKCTMTGSKKSCKFYNIKKGSVLYFSASSKNFKGFGPQSKSIKYVAGAAKYVSTPYSPSPAYSTPPTDSPSPGSGGGNGASIGVTNSGSRGYVINAADNPSITVVRGMTYTITVNAPGHPFQIQTVSGSYNASNTYSVGVTNGGAQVGTITWQVPDNAPNTLYYICQFHSAMKGQINVINPS